MSGPDQISITSSEVKSATSRAMNALSTTNAVAANNAALPSLNSTATVRANNAASLVPRNESVKSIMDEIASIDTRYKQAGQFDPAYRGITEMTLKGRTIGVRCMLRAMAREQAFLPDQKTAECGDSIKFMQQTEILDELKTGTMASNEALYDQLYQMSLSMTDFVSKSPEMSQLSPAGVARLHERLQQFMLYNLKYLRDFLKKYMVTNKDLLRSGYNLMFLINSLNYAYAENGEDMNRLRDMYDRTTAAINENIALFNSVDLDALIKAKPANASALLDQYRTSLTSQLAVLQAQQAELKTNISAIAADHSSLSNLVSSGVLDIGKRFVH